MSSISMTRLRDYCNEYLGIVFKSAQTQLEIADAERERDVVSKLFHWIEISEDMKKERKEEERK